MIRAVSEMIEGYGRISKKATTEKGTREIRGFVSTLNMDRHGDTIDPALFDIKTFLKNPQVFVDHMPWVTANGNAISVGVVNSLIPAKAEKNDKSGYNIVSIEDDSVVDTIPEEEAGIVEDGTRGLWGVLTIMEKDVITLINDGRLNAFSWRGDLVETRFGKSIDLMEVSLVFIPANASALFMVTKSVSKNNDKRESYVIAKGANIFVSVNRLPEDVDAVVDQSSSKYAVYVKSESGKSDFMEVYSDTDLQADAFSASIYSARADAEKVTLLKNTYLVTSDGEPIYEVMNELSRVEMVRAKWSTAYKNDLPDSAFGYVEPGEKDADGKTTPRSKRHFPLKDKNGKYDEDHVRNALARMSQSEFGEKAKPKILAAARALGIQVGKKSFDAGDDLEAITIEGGETSMPFSKEDISALISEAVSTQFKALFDALDKKDAEKVEKSAEETASAEGTETVATEQATETVKADETVVTPEATTEAAETTEVVEKSEEDEGKALAETISNAINDAVASAMGTLQKRIDAIETKPMVKSQAASEAEEETTTTPDSPLIALSKITDKKEKSVALRKLLETAMFGTEDR